MLYLCWKKICAARFWLGPFLHYLPSVIPLPFSQTISKSLFVLGWILRNTEQKKENFSCEDVLCTLMYTKLSINRDKIWLSTNQFTNRVKQKQKHISGSGITLFITDAMCSLTISQLNNIGTLFCEDSAQITHFNTTWTNFSNFTTSSIVIKVCFLNIKLPK